MTLRRRSWWFFTWRCDVCSDIAEKMLHAGVELGADHPEIDVRERDDGGPICEPHAQTEDREPPYLMTEDELAPWLATPN